MMTLLEINLNQSGVLNKGWEKKFEPLLCNVQYFPALTIQVHKPQLTLEPQQLSSLNSDILAMLAGNRKP